MSVGGPLQKKGEKFLLFQVTGEEPEKTPRGASLKMQEGKIMCGAFTEKKRRQKKQPQKKNSITLKKGKKSPSYSRHWEGKAYRQLRRGLGRNTSPTDRMKGGETATSIFSSGEGKNVLILLREKYHCRVPSGDLRGGP